MTKIEEMFHKFFDGEDTYPSDLIIFTAGWQACIQHEKDQLAKSLAEFDNDDNDCGSGGCIL